MEKIVMREVCSAEEIQGLSGCTITNVSGPEDDGVGGVCLDCKDEAGNLVSFLIMEDGSWHFYDARDHVKKNLTLEQYGGIAQLFDHPMVDSICIKKLGSIAEIVIKVIGEERVEPIFAAIKGMFPMLEAIESRWDFEGEFYPMYNCGDPGYNLDISIAVMPEPRESVEGGE